MSGEGVGAGRFSGIRRHTGTHMHGGTATATRHEPDGVEGRREEGNMMCCPLPPHRSTHQVGAREEEVREGGGKARGRGEERGEKGGRQGEEDGVGSRGCVQCSRAVECGPKHKDGSGRRTKRRKGNRKQEETSSLETVRTPRGGRGTGEAGRGKGWGWGTWGSRRRACLISTHRHGCKKERGGAGGAKWATHGQHALETSPGDADTRQRHSRGEGGDEGV